jgi:hypothetical protein
MTGIESMNGKILGPYDDNAELLDAPLRI